MIPYHKFLIRTRVYCERCVAPVPAEHVIKVDNRDLVVCDTHADLLVSINKKDENEQIESNRNNS